VWRGRWGSETQNPAPLCPFFPAARPSSLPAVEEKASGRRWETATYTLRRVSFSVDRLVVCWWLILVRSAELTTTFSFFPHFFFANGRHASRRASIYSTATSAPCELTATAASTPGLPQIIAPGVDVREQTRCKSIGRVAADETCRTTRAYLDCVA